MGNFRNKKYSFEEWWPGDEQFIAGQDSTDGAAQAARRVAREHNMRFHIRTESDHEGEQGVYIVRIK